MIFKKKNKVKETTVKKRDKKERTMLIVFWCLIGVGFLTLVFVAFAAYMFPADSFLANVFDDRYTDILGVKTLRVLLTVFVFAGVYAIGKLISLRGKHIKHNTVKTWFLLIGNVISYVAIIVGFISVLGKLGVNTTALMTGTSILTLVIGLGCQSLVQDIVAGVSILLENKFQVGDIVVISGWRGTVDQIGLRTTSIRDDLGNIKIINNSLITDIVNNTKDLSYALIEVGVEYGESITHIEEVINANIHRFAKDIPTIIGEAMYKGVVSLGDSSVVIRLMAGCKEENKYQTERDMNREIKIIFDENNINIPFPQVVINYRDKQQ